MDVRVVQNLDLLLEEPGDEDAQTHSQEVMELQEQVESHQGDQDPSHHVAHQHHVSQDCLTV